MDGEPQCQSKMGVQELDLLDLIPFSCHSLLCDPGQLSILPCLSYRIRKMELITVPAPQHPCAARQALAGTSPTIRSHK